MSQPAIAGFAEFARLAGFKPSYVTQLKGDGRLVLTEDGRKVRVAESLALIESTRDPAKAGVAARHAASRAYAPPAADAGADPAPEAASRAYAPPAADASVGGTYQAARAVKERYLAMAAKRDYEVSIGKLMDAGEVASAVAAAATTLRIRFEGLPDVLGPQLAGITDEATCRRLLAEAIEHALEEVSRQFRAITRKETV